MTSSSLPPFSTSRDLYEHNNASPPTPPSSPSYYSEPDIPVIPVDDLGMVADDELLPDNGSLQASPPVKSRNNALKKTTKRRRITYVSRHFNQTAVKVEETPTLEDNAGLNPAVSADPQNAQPAYGALTTPPVTPSKSRATIYHGFDIDDFSSDSSLTDVPDDIGPDPFPPDHSSQSPSPNLKSKKPRRPTKSPYFPQPHKHRSNFLSTLPFPPLSHATFGLMQERLAHDPFRLLIATIFLNKTPGERAMPIFYELMSRYPTPTDLASANTQDITAIIYGLGFQNQRAAKCVAMAKVWIENPPTMGKRYRKMNYPSKGDGRGISQDEVVDDTDPRVAWEISHLPGLGPYSHDSWRMFCRDRLRGLSSGWNGENAHDAESFEPEWKRVLPLDKELRAWMTWMWMKEGWIWNKETGERNKASQELMAKANGGGIVVEERDSSHLVVSSIDGDDIDTLQDLRKVERTAGNFLPSTSTVSLDRT